jgi:hypothetical protein
MRAVVLILLLIGTLAAPALAQGAQLLSKQSLYHRVTQSSSKEEIKAICAEIIARQNDSPVAMADAASLYKRGMIMGVSCAKVDYYKAFMLARDSGDAFVLKATLTFIRERVAAGVPRAVSAWEKIERELD